MVIVPAVAGLIEPSAVYPEGRLNDGVTGVAVFTTKAGVVPNAAVPLQSNTTIPEEPVTTDDRLGVNVAQFEVNAAVVADIVGNVCVKSVVAA